jgi:hypothetical protein
LFLSFPSLWLFFSSLFSVDEEPVEGALSLALPRLVQMGFIVPDVARTLEEEQKEEALKMGNPKAALAHNCPVTDHRCIFFQFKYVADSINKTKSST